MIYTDLVNRHLAKTFPHSKDPVILEEEVKPLSELRSKTGRLLNSNSNAGRLRQILLEQLEPMGSDELLAELQRRYPGEYEYNTPTEVTSWLSNERKRGRVQGVGKRKKQLWKLESEHQ